jgi:hypothetical protein
MQLGQHPHEVALGLKTAFSNPQIWLSKEQSPALQTIWGQTVADSVQTQTARRINSSFVWNEHKINETLLIV